MSALESRKNMINGYFRLKVWLFVHFPYLSVSSIGTPAFLAAEL